MTVPDPPPRKDSGRWRQVQRLPLTLMLASLLVGLGIVQLTFQLGLMTYRTVTWSRETQATLARVHGLERDVRVLRDAQQAAYDPAYLETLARCEGYVGEREQVIVSPDAPGTAENCAPVRLP
ncbi:cell division protein FtsB [Deinococcus hopiensis]|nr:cell division protein FtsB [Deinococcus hopiensis]